MVDGKVESFILALIAKRDVFQDEGSEKEWSRLEYGFISGGCNMHTKGMYSGGATGFGTRDFEPMDERWHKNNRIVTYDYIEMNRIADEEEKKWDEMEAKRLKWLDEVAFKINALPEQFTVGVLKLDGLLEFRRTKAEIRNGKMYGGNICLVKKESGRAVFLENFVNGSDHLLSNKFGKEMGFMFPNIELNARSALSAILYRKEELKYMVKEQSK